MTGLDWQTWRMSFVKGLNQKLSTREIEPPDLTIARDVQFDKTGDLQTRYPFATLGTDILGGGSLSNVRRGVENGDEKLVFTKDTLYSWNAQMSKWVSKGAHLAVKVNEKNIFVTGKEQVEVDRAELSNTVLFCWRESTTVYVGAIDKTTGSVLVAPTALASAGNPTRPRLVALSTKILLFTVQDGTGGTTEGLGVRAIDPADVATGIASVLTHVVTSTSSLDYYDATRVLGADQAVCAVVLNPTTSYTVATVTASLTVATSTKVRSCDGCIAVSSHPLGTHVQIARQNSANVQGDYIAISGLADVYTAQAIGTCPSNLTQIAAAHRSTQDSSQYRCYVFWTWGRDVDGSVAWDSEYNWVDTGNNLGTEAVFVKRMDVGSRAFDHDGRVYVWMIHGTAAGLNSQTGQLQNASYLYRDDAFLCAKATAYRGGGFLTPGHLPGVASVGSSQFAYCATDRTVFGALESNNFTGKRPRDVVVTFDSNEARRTARLGRTLYISGGEILQYDGVRLTEVGFHVWSWYLALSQSAGGSLDDGTYAFKHSYVSNNAQAELDRSASIPVWTHTVTGGPRRVAVSGIIPLYVTHKPALAVEVWRTLKNPTDDAPYYLTTTPDPSDLTNPNRYLPNDSTADSLSTVNDDRADSTLDDYGTHPQDGVLENLAPPAATIIAATDTRLFLAGIPGEPNTIWYSKQRGEGEVAAFHDALTATVPPTGGDLTSLAFLNETLVAFRENAIYMLPGDGFDNAGGGQNYGPARAISTDIGAVNHESVAVTEKGLVFKSNKGWYLLSRGWSLEYIGAGVMDYDTETPLAVHLVESQHQLRILTASRMLVLDTLGGQWFEWTVNDGVHACMWQGTHAYLTSTAPKTQQTSYATAAYGIDVETAWIDLSKMAAFGRVRRVEVRGEYRAAHSLRVRLARDFWVDGVDTYFDDDTWTPSPTTVGGPLEVEQGPAIQQVNALKVRITVTPTTFGESCKLSALSFELGFKRGLFRRLPAAQRQ